MNGPESGKFLDVGHNHRIYYEEHGNPKGAPLLLVHGGSGFTLDMDKMTALHGSDRRIIVMHQRGIGKSTPPGEHRHNSVQDNIDDIERLRSHLGLAKMDVFSWSFGTAFAAGYALQHPERLKSLTAYAPYMGSEEDYAVLSKKKPDMAETYFNLHGARHGKGIVTSVFNKAAKGDTKSRFNAYWTALQLTMDNPPDKDELYRSKSPKEWETFFNIRLIGAQHDLELFTGKSRFLEKQARALRERHGGQTPFPVTLIYGRDDNWSAPNAYAQRVFPKSGQVIVPGAGHDVHDPAVQNVLGQMLGNKRSKAPKAAFRAGFAPRR